MKFVEKEKQKNQKINCSLRSFTEKNWLNKAFCPTSVFFVPLGKNLPLYYLEYFCPPPFLSKVFGNTKLHKKNYLEIYFFMILFTK